MNTGYGGTGHVIFAVYLDMQVMVVRFKLRPGVIDQAEAVIEEFVRVVGERESSILEYQSLRDTNDPSVFLHYIKFEDENSHRPHRQAAHVKEFVRKLYPLCEDDPLAQFFDVFASAGATG